MDTIPKQFDIKFDTNIDKATNFDQKCSNFFKNYISIRLDRLRLKLRFMPRYLS